MPEAFFLKLVITIVSCDYKLTYLLARVSVLFWYNNVDILNYAINSDIVMNFNKESYSHWCKNIFLNKSIWKSITKIFILKRPSKDIHTRVGILYLCCLKDESTCFTGNCVSILIVCSKSPWHRFLVYVKQKNDWVTWHGYILGWRVNKWWYEWLHVQRCPNLIGRNIITSKLCK